MKAESYAMRFDPSRVRKSNPFEAYLSNLGTALNFSAPRRRRHAAFRALEAVSAAEVNQGHINFNIDEWIWRLRDITMDVMVNNPFGRRFKQEMIKGVLGAEGLTPEFTPEFDPDAADGDSSSLDARGELMMAMQSLWERRVALPDMAQEREPHNWGGIRRRDEMALVSLLGNGEYFMVFDPDRTSPWGFTYRMIPSWRCPMGLMRGENDKGHVTLYGKEYDPDGHRLLGYYFLRRRWQDEYMSRKDTRYFSPVYGALGEDIDFEIVPAARVAHVYIKSVGDQEQERGFPEMSAAVFALAAETRYTEIAQVAAATASRLLAVIYNDAQTNAGLTSNEIHAAAEAARRESEKEKKDGEGEGEGEGDGAGDGAGSNEGDAADDDRPSQTGPAAGRKVYYVDPDGFETSEEMGEVAALHLSNRDKVMFPPNTQPDPNHGNFVKEMQLAAAAGAGLSLEYFTGRLEGNYSNIRLAQISDRGSFAHLRRRLVDGHLRMDCAFMLAAALGPGGELREYIGEREVVRMANATADWQGPGQPFIDPVKQLNAMATAQATGLATGSDLMRGLSDIGVGRSLDKHFRRLAFEKWLQEKYGVHFGPPIKGDGKSPVMSSERDADSRHPPKPGDKKLPLRIRREMPKS